MILNDMLSDAMSDLNTDVQDMLLGHGWLFRRKRDPCIPCLWVDLNFI